MFFYPRYRVEPSCTTLNFLFWVLSSCLRLRKVILEAPCSLFSPSSPPVSYTISCTTPALHALVPTLRPLSCFFSFSPRPALFCRYSTTLVVCLFLRRSPHRIILSPFLRAQPILLIPRYHFCSPFPPSTRPHKPSMCSIYPFPALYSRVTSTIATKMINLSPTCTPSLHRRLSLLPLRPSLAMNPPPLPAPLVPFRASRTDICSRDSVISPLLLFLCLGLCSLALIVVPCA